MNDGTARNTMHFRYQHLLLYGKNTSMVRLNWQHNNDKGHLSGDGELNPHGYLLHSLSVTSPPPRMNQWDAQLTFPERLRLAWHDTQTSNWPTSGHWSICGSLGMCRIQSAFSNYTSLFRLKARNDPTSRLLFWSKSNQRHASSVC